MYFDKHVSMHFFPFIWHIVNFFPFKVFNSLVILGAWILWKLRNYCMFDESAPNVQTALQAFKDEANLWIVGGAKALGVLGLGRVT